MPEFLELLETIRSEEADVQRLFGDAGQGMRHVQRRAQYSQQLLEAAKLIADVFDGRKHPMVLREAMTTSDFPYLFGDILDRQLLANYREWPSIWRTYARQAIVNDFRTVNRFAIGGGEAVLDEVPEQGAYPMAALSESRYQYAVKKYGRRIPLSWEALINDDLGALTDIPQRFGRASRRSEDKFATQLHVDANGPHASVYTAGNKNIITSNPALSIAGLQTGYKVLAAMLDSDGEPIMIDGVILEVPPALEITARNILNATQLYVGAVGDNQLVTLNWMKERTTLVVNPYIPLVATVADGDTCWFLHASPSSGNPAFEIGLLRGHAEPEIFMKAPNAQRVGGGIVNPLDGDFDSDSVEYKVRHVFGGSTLNPKMTVASEGDGA